MPCKNCCMENDLCKQRIQIFLGFWSFRLGMFPENIISIFPGLSQFKEVVEFGRHCCVTFVTQKWTFSAGILSCETSVIAGVLIHLEFSIPKEFHNYFIYLFICTASCDWRTWTRLKTEFEFYIFLNISSCILPDRQKKVTTVSQSQQ